MSEKPPAHGRVHRARTRLSGRVRNERGDVLFEMVILIGVLGTVFAWFVTAQAITTHVQRKAAGRNVAHQYAQTLLEKSAATPWATLLSCGDDGATDGPQIAANGERAAYQHTGCPAGRPDRVTDETQMGYALHSELLITWHTPATDPAPPPGAGGTKTVTVTVDYWPAGNPDLAKTLRRTVQRTSLPADANLTPGLPDAS